MKEILLIGGGGHCRAVIDVIEQENKYRIAGIVDKKDLVEQEVLGYKIVGCDDDLEQLFKTYKYAFVSVGHIKSNEVRVKIFNQLLQIGYELPTIISPRAYVSKYANISEGTIIMHDALVNAGAQISHNCIINTKALIEHDVLVGGHCHISTGAVINGGVVVQSNTFVGSNATSKQVIEISGFIKAGSLVK